MKPRLNRLSLCAVLLLTALLLCGWSGEEKPGLLPVYAVAALLSLLLMVVYCCLIRRKEIWFFVLFAAVFIVNSGYLALALSGTLEEALLANRISYLGSVFLPLSMLMIITDTCGLVRNKWLTAMLLCLSIGVFVVTASPGYLDIYYREVQFVRVDGVSLLKKVYGPWHKLYPVYLLGMFAAMTGVILCAALRKRLRSSGHAVLLLGAVFVNIGVWLLEQLTELHFEFLSVSYLITELFLIGIYWLLQGLPTAASEVAAAVTPEVPVPVPSAAVEEGALLQFRRGLEELTPTERLIYERYLEKRSTKEIMAELRITENTLKFHNKNLYGKLGVSSRKELQRIACAQNPPEE